MRISVWRSDVCSSDRLGMRVVPSQVKVLLLGAGGGGGGAKGGKGGSGGSGRGGGGGAGNAGKTAKSGKQAKTAKPRKKSLRERFLGRTPGEKSKTGRAVQEIGRAHVWTPVTHAHIVCPLMLDKKKRLDPQQAIGAKTQ